MSKKPIPSPELLRKLLRYEPLTGKLFWRERTPDMFKATASRTAVHICNNWTSLFAGKEALACVNPRGYRNGEVLGTSLLAHRVIWAMETGAWPVDQIDHEDHDRSNNRFMNLSEATHAENGKNQSMKSNNASGFNGVTWNKKARKWHARITIDRTLNHLGYFTNISDAIASRKAANDKHGFHANHGTR